MFIKNQRIQTKIIACLLSLVMIFMLLPMLGLTAAGAELWENLERPILLPVGTEDARITTEIVPPGTVGLQYAQVTLRTTGFASTPTFRVVRGILPPGLTLSSAGTFLGTPIALGTYTFTVEASAIIRSIETNGESINIYQRATREYTIIIHSNLAEGLPVITTETLPNGIVGTQYEQTTLHSSAFPQTPSWSVIRGALPHGLSLSRTGVISGTPTVDGLYVFTVEARDGAGRNAARELSINIGADHFDGVTLPPIAINSHYSYDIGLSGQDGWTVSVSSGSLPPGLSLNPATGRIEGRATQQGTFHFTITATFNNPSYNIPFRQTVTAQVPATPPTAVTSVSLIPSTASVTAGSTLSPPLTANITPANALSRGVRWYTRNPNIVTVHPRYGVVSGVAPGTAVVFARTVDGGHRAESTVTVTEAPPPQVTITVTAGAGGTATGGGTVPSGTNVTLNAVPDSGWEFEGWFEGNTRVSASAVWTFSATANRTLQARFTQALPPAEITTLTLPNGTVGVPYNQALQSTGFAQSLTWNVLSGVLPPGLALSSAGVIAGTPTAAGDYSFIVEASDATGRRAARRYTIIINSPAGMDMDEPMPEPTTAPPTTTFAPPPLPTEPPAPQPPADAPDPEYPYGMIYLPMLMLFALGLLMIITGTFLYSGSKNKNKVNET